MVSFIASLEVQKFAENLPFQEEQVTCQEKVNGTDRRFFADLIGGDGQIAAEVLC
jgi:hypothetical protein